MRRAFLLFYFTFLYTSLSFSESSPTPESSKITSANPTKAVTTVRLLTVGNSFSRNATHYLSDLATADGNVLNHRSIYVGGASLQLHLEKAQKHEVNPADKAGLYETGRSLKDDLLAEPWDYITLQQASIKSHDVSTYRPYAQQLHEYLKKYSPNATILLHQTWAYRVDDPRFARKAPKAGEPKTQQEMYQGLNQAYQTIADELKIDLIPVGDAFYLANTDAKWSFQPDFTFDPKKIQHPNLPLQQHSLHIGWQWKKQKDQWKITMDGHHANVAGEYLGACVFYETLFHLTCVGNTFIPKGLDSEYARFLQETAHAAVTKRRK